MTTNTTALTQKLRSLDRFPEFPPREDMRNTSHLHLRSVITSLVIHYAHLENTLVHGEVPGALTLSPWGCYRIPDLIVAFDCDISDIYDLSGYAIDRQGKPPNFVLKVASKTTGIADYTSKRSDYERYGAPDYWRFDPTECERHAVALAANVLTEHAEYQPIEIEWITERRCRGYSEALGLYVCR